MLRRCFRSTSGSAAIEFAVIVPLLVTMIAAVVEIGRTYQVYNAVNRLATQYAITWSDCSDLPAGTCATEMAAFGSTGLRTNMAPQLQSSALTLSMFQVSMSGSTPNVTYAYPTGAAMTASQVSAAQSVLTDGQTGVIVTASYAHTLQYFSAMMTPYLASVLLSSFTAVQLKG